MPYGNRGILAALAGLAALFWAFMLGVGVTALDPQEQRYQSHRYAADQPAEIESAATGQTGSQALQHRTPCEQPKGHDESELCAQWKAANAAEDSAFWAKCGFWIGVVGSGFLLGQIILTRRAVEDTATATKAVQDQNAFYFERERAFLRVTGVGPGGRDEECTPPMLLAMDVLNEGVSPARILTVHYKYVRQRGWPESFELGGTHRKKRIILPRATEPFVLGMENLSSLLHDTNTVWLCIEIEYQTLGRDGLKTYAGFKMERDPQRLPLDRQWTFTESDIGGRPPDT